METFRITTKKYSSAISCSGKANRWNKDNEMVFYTGSTRSLSTLELVVHQNSIQPFANYEVMIISIADEEDLFEQVFVKDLPSNWRSRKAYPQLQQTGSDWYKSMRSLVLKVPSAVIVNEYNYIVNTEHKKFRSKVRLVRREEYFWDRRLAGR